MPSASIGANLKYPDFLLSGEAVANVKGQKKSKL
jgi:peroxisomal 2,4-dienoyl-CoA reductase